ncbi:hypothetical protein RND71_023422 [Anisodus tanguticus]|uniref:Uncharacterized protein n=1 Tax=Anisodus tanguticus TaxID=243964 RepID=A0AAE1RVH8_9SOLA|nr:hypothetical protein RND71_023422 [Anisodus tanguticus]
MSEFCCEDVALAKYLEKILEKPEEEKESRLSNLGRGYHSRTPFSTAKAGNDERTPLSQIGREKTTSVPIRSIQNGSDNPLSIPRALSGRIGIKSYSLQSNPCSRSQSLGLISSAPTHENIAALERESVSGEQSLVASPQHSVESGSFHRVPCGRALAQRIKGTVRKDSSSSKFGGCGHICANSGNGYKGEIKRKLYPTRDGRKLEERPDRLTSANYVL